MPCLSFVIETHWYVEHTKALYIFRDIPSNAPRAPYSFWESWQSKGGPPFRQALVEELELIEFEELKNKSLELNSGGNAVGSTPEARGESRATYKDWA